MYIQNPKYKYNKNNIPPSAASSSKTVRCKLCGRTIKLDLAYCIVNGPRKDYYCSREEYEGGEKYVEKRNKYEYGTINLIKNILNCEGLDEELYNSLSISWLKKGSAESIYYFLLENQENLRYIIAEKGIESSNSRFKYLSAIISNKIIDYKVVIPQEETIEIREDIDYSDYRPRLTPRKGIRRSMEELEDEYKPN